jgi:hypothetical protein
MIASAIERYRRALDIDPELVSPLFFSSFMSLAVREAPRLTAERLPNGYQVRALELLAAHADTPVLSHLLQVEARG